jgi:oligopeptide transport system substrate-binding protein
MISSGPFVLKKYRRYEEISVVRNPLYYDAGQVGIDELQFRPIVDGVTLLNLYKSGDVTALPGVGFPSLFVPAVEHKRDFHPEPGFGTVVSVMNVNRPPLDDPRLRYALNMAVEKEALCHFLGLGRVPARNLVPPIPDYRAPASLVVDVGGREYDILQFNVEAARALLANAGAKPSEITYHYAIIADNTHKSEMMQRQLLEHLGIRLKLVPHEFNEQWNMVLSGEYQGLADYAFLPLYFDPNPFLDPFVTPAAGNPAGWIDEAFPGMLAEANRTLDRAERMRKLVECEERLLRAMPLIPVFFDAWGYMCKPYVRGLTSNLFDTRAFKYAWIDRNWRAA